MFGNSYRSLEPMNLCSMNPQFAPALIHPREMEIADAVKKVKITIWSGAWGKGGLILSFCSIHSFKKSK